MTVGDGVCRASFDAIAAKNAPRVVDVINGSVAFSSGNPVRIRIFRGLDIDTIRRARRRTKEASYALLEAILVPVQYVDSAISRLEMYWLVRVILRDGLPEHIPERHSEPLEHRAERLSDFANGRSHENSLADRSISTKHAAVLPNFSTPPRSVFRGTGHSR
jgi:hypothetical protein